MLSGKYRALAGALSREQAMDNISNNLANINTVGFKKDQLNFRVVLEEAKQGVDNETYNKQLKGSATDFSQGAFKVTNNPYDIAIDGEGFFKVSAGNNTFYTRNGAFVLDKNGALKTSDGFKVLDDSGQPLIINNTGADNITFNENGNIFVNGAQIGRLQIFTIDDTTKLQKAGNQLFKLDSSGNETEQEEARIIQGSLELSNTNIMAEMALMIDNGHKFDMLHKVIKSYSTLSEKQNELGTVG